LAAARLFKEHAMMTAHVNADAIVLRFDFAGNLSPQQWEILLDQLRSEHIPNLYQTGKRLHMTVEPGGGITRAVIYLTNQTVTKDQAVDILHHWNIDVHVARSA
jgi:hypothetical protein